MVPDQTPNEDWAEMLAGLPRRTTLKAGAVTLGTLGLATPAAASEHEDDDEQTETPQDVDEPEGFEAEVVAPHATLTDDVSMNFQVDGEEATVEDGSTIVVAEATWEPEGTTGWHTHPGPVIVSVVEGDLDLVFAEDCETTSYAAGEAFVDPGGHDVVARNPSESDETVIYATFLGVPEGEDPTEWVEPADC